MKGIGEGNKSVGRQIPIEIIRGDVITRMSRLAAERARRSTTRKKRFMESHISPKLADNQIVKRSITRMTSPEIGFGLLGVGKVIGLVAYHFPIPQKKDRLRR